MLRHCKCRILDTDNRFHLGKSVKQPSRNARVNYKFGAPKRIRIAVAGLKGQCPRPLDDGGMLAKYSRDRFSRQYLTLQYATMLEKR